MTWKSDMRQINIEKGKAYMKSFFVIFFNPQKFSQSFSNSPHPAQNHPKKRMFVLKRDTEGQSSAIHASIIYYKLTHGMESFYVANPKGTLNKSWMKLNGFSDLYLYLT